MREAVDNATPARLVEPFRVGLLRWVLRHWPLARGRGRGVLLRAAWPFLPKAPLVMALEPGIVVPVNPLDYMAMHHFINGLEQDPSFGLARRLVSPGDCVIDVGANLGYWIMGIAKKVGPGGSLHAFEPLPENFDHLRSNLVRNRLQWVQCHEMAVAETAGQASFLMPPRAHSGRGHIATSPTGSTVTVRITRLDDYCREHALDRVDLLKVDVEGAEIRVFQGASELLSGPTAPIVMFEVGDYLAAELGTTTAATKRCLLEHGYEITRYTKGRLALVTATEPHPCSEDLFALRPEHFERHPWLGGLMSDASPRELK